MKTAIVFYSMSGNTKMIADQIAKALSADMIELIPEKAYPDKGMKKFIWGGKAAVMGDKPALEPYSFDAGAYDLILFGSPVWASSVAPPIRTFISENKNDLRSKQFGVFLCYSGGGADKAILKLKKLLDIENFKAEVALIDPIDKPSSDYDHAVEEFCKKAN